eukprot:4850398-Alexandrium_andersonii.AAC.1
MLVVDARLPASRRRLLATSPEGEVPVPGLGDAHVHRRWFVEPASPFPTSTALPHWECNAPASSGGVANALLEPVL